MTNKYIKKSEGFTLVELSIVIIIIGFLIAGIAAGQSLIKQGQLSAITRDLSSYKSAALLFKSKYDYFPGDLPNASSYLPSVPAEGNGDGNGRIDSNFSNGTPLEDTYSWNHMSLAGLITGNFIGGLQGPRMEIGVNAPTSPIGTNTGYFLHSSAPYVAEYLVYIELGSPDPANGFLDNAVMTSQDAFHIDSKIDDGKPSTGLLKAGSGWALDNTGVCVDTGINQASNTVNYVFSDNTVSCRLFYLVDTDN